MCVVSQTVQGRSACMLCISIPCSFYSDVSKLCVSSTIKASLFISPSGMLCMFTCPYSFYLPNCFAAKQVFTNNLPFPSVYFNQVGLVFFFYIALDIFFPSLWQQDNVCWFWTKVSKDVFCASFISEMSQSEKKRGPMDINLENWILYLVLLNVSYWHSEPNLEVWSNCN